jgi:hypothetical protein
MEMEKEGAQPTGGRFEARIDNLLSSALQDQAREQRMLFEIVQGARAALAKAEEELGALRILIERRDQSVVDLLEARLSGVGTEQGLDRLAKQIAEIESHIDEATRRSGEAAARREEEAFARIDSDLASRQSAAAATSRQIEALSRQIEEIRSAVAAQSSATATSITEALSPFTENLEALSERIRQSNRRITESNSRLEAMHESILNYLSTRDERLEESRDQILTNLVTQITQDLSRHDRIRITTAFKQAEQHRKDQRDAARYRRLKQKGKLPDPEPAPIPEAEIPSPEPKPLPKLKPKAPRSRTKHL